PEALSLGAPDGAKFEVRLVEELGADSYVYGTLFGDTPDSAPFVVRCDGREPPGIGDVVTVAPRADEVHAFDLESGLRLG
ncbi:MAG TPA: TOBE domain-containing protein, partial [Jatrophihabitantaceae bacterium]|nr:TOBE domain-containing protein [Jatrophihabitantaceae bacterium]